MRTSSFLSTLSVAIWFCALSPFTSSLKALPWDTEAGWASENGDTNGDLLRDMVDGVYLLRFLFQGGSAPVPLALCGTDAPQVENGDTNGDQVLDISDATSLLGWLFLGGSEPASACGEGSGAGRNPNPRVIPINANAFGKSYGEWGAAWWQWGLLAPAAVNPLTDTTGEFCDVNQSGKVWFLAGTFGEPHSVSRTCTIPTGKAIFFPILNSFCSAEGTEEEMRACAASFIEDVTGLEVSIDGVPLQNLEAYRADSPNFVLTLPEGDLFGAGPGEFEPSVADGFWILLAPLPPGEHTIYLRGEVAGGADEGGFETEVFYTLTVVGGGS